MTHVPSGWRSWITTSPLALRVDHWVARVALICVVICAAVLIVTVFGGQPVPDVGVLLLPGIPILFGGQAWSIAVLNALRPKSSGTFRQRLAEQRTASRSPRALFYPDLPQRVSRAVTATFLIGWVGGMSAFLSLGQGDPSPGTPGCPWPLNNHGVVTCVSHAKYVSVSAAGERLAAGIMMVFFAVHFAIATSEAIRRQTTRYPGRSARLSCP
jgi:hypothetical protein